MLSRDFEQAFSHCQDTRDSSRLPFKLVVQCAIFAPGMPDSHTACKKGILEKKLFFIKRRRRKGKVQPPPHRPETSRRTYLRAAASPNYSLFLYLIKSKQPLQILTKKEYLMEHPSTLGNPTYIFSHKNLNYYNNILTYA